MRNNWLGRSHSEGARDVTPLNEPADVQVTEIAGYRIVRRLAAGRKASVYLGHPVAASIGSARVAASADSVALRVFHADLAAEDAASIDSELAVLASLPPGIAPALYDIVTVPDGRTCVVMERDDGLTLAELLRSRGSIRAGEAVTILAPLTAGLSRLHSSGWAHAALSPAVVRFDADGRARWAGWGSAVALVGDHIGRTRLIQSDYESFASIVRETCASIDAQSVTRRELEVLVVWMTEQLSAHPFIPFAEHLERRLFALAKPLAVRLSRSDEGEGSQPQRVPARVGLRGQAATDTPHARVDEKLRVSAVGRDDFSVPASPHGPVGTPLVCEDNPDRPPGGFWRALGASEPLGVVIAGTADGFSRSGSMSAMRKKALGALQSRRSALLVSACIAGAFFVTAITLIPPQGTGDPSASAQRAAETPTKNSLAPFVAPSSSPGATTSLRAEEPPEDTGEPSTAESGSSHSDDPRFGDDPVLAAQALLAIREACFREASVLCLADVDASASPLSEADSLSIRQAQQSAATVMPTPYDLEKLSVVEKNGAAVLLSMVTSDAETKPASLLMMRSEAGWRLREIFDY